MAADYKALGLKVGLEFHQRLDTSKLFCNCDAAFEEEPVGEAVRRLRPVAGELGITDPAALQEFLRGREFAYQTFRDSVDLVELDEEPPHQMNPEALEIALEIALLLNCRVFDEIQVMRKTVIDGSAISGFQRTSMVGADGFLETPHGRVSIPGVYLEEESAGIVGAKGSRVTYRLDRLAIPLVEIATGIMEFSPQQVKEVALKIGELLRITGRVQRGLGTIRQDVNISIAGGERIEIKGVQDVRILDKFVEYEVQRQLGLIELKRKIPKVKPEIDDFSKFFHATRCGFLRKCLEDKGRVLGIALPGFRGLLGMELCPGRRFGTELADRARSFGVGGLIHTDEDLGKYGIESDVEAIRKYLGLGEADAMIFIADSEAKARKALEAVVERIGLAATGVPRETRRSLPDGATEYMRPLPGSARMYPETDLEPVSISRDRLREIAGRLPAKPEKILEDLIKKYKLSEELAERMVASRNARFFYRLCDELAIEPTLAAVTLEQTMRQLSREGVTNLGEEHLLNMFTLLKQGRFSKEAIPEILRSWSRRPDQLLDEVLKEGGFGAISEAEIRGAARKLAAATKAGKGSAFNVVMGEMMRQFRGKADGGLIARIVKEELKL